MFDNDTVLITGGTGSFGSHFTKYLLENTSADIVIFSRDEYKQFELRKELKSNRVDFIIGDIRDEKAIREAAAGVDYIVHAAALKHVHTGECQPAETIKTNVVGSINVAAAALSLGHRLQRAVLLSTDKACEPTNLYGATKMCAEKIWLAANTRHRAFSVVRYGNVIGSRGSVLHTFSRMAEHGVFQITDVRMTRFAVTFDYAIRLVMLALNEEPGKIFVGKVPAFKITDLAEAFDPKARFAETGVGAGEKLHETLMTQYEAARAVFVDDHFELDPDAGGMLPNDLSAYTSDSVDPMSREEIQAMIRGLSDGADNP